MHKLLIAAGLIAIAACSAEAQSPTQTPPPLQERGQGRGGLLAADANHDGNITRAEFNAARAARFTQMDANHDGSLQDSERPQYGGGQQASAPGGGMRGDTDHDGVLSRAEYDAQAARMFEHMDADSNGTITTAEMQAMAQRRADRQSQ